MLKNQCKISLLLHLRSKNCKVRLLQLIMVPKNVFVSVSLDHLEWKTDNEKLIIIKNALRCSLGSMVGCKFEYQIWTLVFSFFLVACTRLYISHRVCQSVRNTFPSRAVYALPPLPNHMRLKLSCIWHPTLPLPSPLPPLPPQPPKGGLTAPAQLNASSFCITAPAQ